MDGFVCFLCAKQLLAISVDDSTEYQKSKFEEHLSVFHEVIFDVDYLFAATKLNKHQRHEVFKTELNLLPSNFGNIKLDAFEIKDDIILHPDLETKRDIILHSKIKINCDIIFPNGIISKDKCIVPIILETKDDIIPPCLLETKDDLIVPANTKTEKDVILFSGLENKECFTMKGTKIVKR